MRWRRPSRLVRRMHGFQEQFGARVRNLRKQRGLSQESLAARTGFHSNYIGGIERGTTKLSLLNAVRIAEVLGVPLSRLVGPVGQTEGQTRSETKRLRDQVAELLKGQPASRLTVIRDVVKVLTRRAPTRAR